MAYGAWLRNTACLLEGDSVWWSPLQGDLDGPANRQALLASVNALHRQAGGAIQAIAHDLHPDFYSTTLAQQLAAESGVPAVAVQHHHAHTAAVLAEHGVNMPVVGLALDGVIDLSPLFTSWLRQATLTAQALDEAAVRLHLTLADVLATYAVQVAHNATKIVAACASYTSAAACFLSNSQRSPTCV